MNDADEVRFVDYFTGATFMGVNTGCGNGGAAYAAGSPPSLAYACRNAEVPGASASVEGPCSASGTRFVDCGNGTVTDQVTNLIWMQRADCFPAFDYVEATQAVHDLKSGDCGLNDHSDSGQWRVPTRAEWATLVSPAVALHCASLLLTDTTATRCYGDPTATNVWSGVEGVSYWSRSATPFGSGEQWDLSTGTALALVSNAPPARIWAVRGGRPSPSRRPDN